MILENLKAKRDELLRMIQSFIDEYGDADDEFVWEQMEELEEVNESIQYYIALA